MQKEILHFKEIGEAHRFRGTLLILHGLFGSLDNWQTVARTLAEIYHVVLADLRNHGRSFRAESMSYPEMAADVAHLIEYLQPLRTTVVGHSMGGKVAMQLAADFPNHLQKLVVIDIAPRAYPPHHQHILEGLNAIPLDKLQSRQQAEEILSHYVDLPSIRQFLLKNLYRTEDNRFTWRFHLPVITREIQQIGAPLTYSQPINIPALFVKGERSSYITDEDAVQIANIFPHSQLITIPNASHWVHAEQPTALIKALHTFVAL
ncbi:MAG: alpha/beta fold hydrolase [Cytophagales bacterium]|nr:alpha/beta fold hydrolase [Bernardetiaceae bacterium]MDW8210506.1 alpha/beta fold hydrolase [Cytophagales bacterium]